MAGYKEGRSKGRGTVLTREEMELVRRFRECDRRAKDAVLDTANYQRHWRGRLRIC